MLFIRFLLLLINFFIWFPVTFYADSTYSYYRKFNLNLSGSFIGLNNWKGESYKNVTFLSGSDFYSSRTAGINHVIVSAKTELGFNGILDSSWVKSADLFNIQYLVRKRNKSLSQSWNALMNSQFMTTFVYEMNSSQQLVRKWKGTFLNPSSVELGYGLGLLFWEKSMINLSLASARFRVDPAVESYVQPEHGVLGQVKRGFLIFDYGVSGQLLLVKNFSTALEWNSSGKVFMKGVQKEQIQFDISNTMSYKFWKFLEMRADLKWVYDPLISFRMQYRNEILFGLFFRFEK